MFLDLDLDTSVTQIRQKLLEIYQLKDQISFPIEANLGHFWMINFYGDQMQCMFIYVKIIMKVQRNYEIPLLRTETEISENIFIAESMAAVKTVQAFPIISKLLSETSKLRNETSNWSFETSSRNFKNIF